MIENLRPLTQEQRQGARKSARNAVIRALGSKPTREQFTHTTISRYPLSVIRLIVLRLKNWTLFGPFIREGSAGPAPLPQTLLG